MDQKLIFILVFFVAIVSCIDEQGLSTRLIAVEDGMELLFGLIITVQDTNTAQFASKLHDSTELI